MQSPLEFWKCVDVTQRSAKFPSYPSSQSSQLPCKSHDLQFSPRTSALQHLLSRHSPWAQVRSDASWQGSPAMLGRHSPALKKGVGGIPPGYIPYSERERENPVGGIQRRSILCQGAVTEYRTTEARTSYWFQGLQPKCRVPSGHAHRSHCVTHRPKFGLSLS